MRRFLKSASFVALVASTAASAEQARERRPLAPLFACLEQTTADVRLTCLEDATRLLQAAEHSRDVVVMDKRQAAELQRVRSVTDRSRIDRPVFVSFDNPLSGVRQAAGKWILETKANGAWIQTDAVDIGRTPRINDRLRVRRGAVGGFLANIGGGPAIRVRRLR